MVRVTQIEEIVVKTDDSNHPERFRLNIFKKDNLGRDWLYI